VWEPASTIFCDKLPTTWLTLNQSIQLWQF
jgi:hypothetical protein